MLSTLNKQRDGRTETINEAQKESWLWITWERHTRTITLANHFGIRLVVIEKKGRSVRRYAQVIFETIRELRQSKPNLLLVQNPSIVLTTLSLILRPLFGYVLVVDAHNEAVAPFSNQSRVAMSLSKFLLKRADRTIVTNDQLIDPVRLAGGVPIVLPDKMPVPIEGGTASMSGDSTAVFVCTFAADEPVDEVMQAVGELSDLMTLYVTGDSAKYREGNELSIPQNVVFTGFLSEPDYWAHLRTADFVIDLTKKDNCMVCGAYESLSAGTPMLLSDNEPTKNYFSNGAVYVGNSKERIRSGIKAIIAGREELNKNILDLQGKVADRWRNLAARAEEELVVISRSSSIRKVT